MPFILYTHKLTDLDLIIGSTGEISPETDLPYCTFLLEIKKKKKKNLKIKCFWSPCCSAAGLRIHHCLCNSAGLTPSPAQWVKEPALPPL